MQIKAAVAAAQGAFDPGSSARASSWRSPT
jgi:hypothetical protein